MTRALINVDPTPPLFRNPTTSEQPFVLTHIECRLFPARGGTEEIGLEDAFTEVGDEAEGRVDEGRGAVGLRVWGGGGG
jgi:hypothetical protein